MYPQSGCDYAPHLFGYLQPFLNAANVGVCRRRGHGLVGPNHHLVKLARGSHRSNSLHGDDVVFIVLLAGYWQVCFLFQFVGNALHDYTPVAFGQGQRLAL